MSSSEWSNTAITNELKNLANLPPEKVQTPGSQFSLALLKIASIVKGEGSNPDVMLAQIQRVCGSPSLPNREIERQWKRAWAKASPRQPQPNGHPNGAANFPAGDSPHEKPATNLAPQINIRDPKTKDFMLAFDQLGYSFRLNILDDTIEVNGKPITDGQAAIIRNQVRDVGLINTSRIGDALMENAYTNQYNPIREYLDSLQWDGKDWIDVLAVGYLTDTSEQSPWAFKRWLIGAVAKVYEKAQNFMLVFDGSQGIGKSVLTRWLCPLPEYFMEGRINPDDKDAMLRLCNKMVWEVSELQSTTRKADREALKGFITTEEVTIRRAYARYDISKPAICSLVGTINEDGAGFLTDPTGNRRFVILNLTAINWAYRQEVDINQVWAQAVNLYKQGESWKLTTPEKEQQSQVNSSYEMESFVHILFNEYYLIDPQSSEWATLNDIINKLEVNGLKGSQQANINELTRILTKGGAKRFRARVGVKRPVAYKGVIPATREVKL